MKAMVLIDPEALDKIMARLDGIEAKLDAVQMTPAPEWLTVKDYATHIGRDVSTVRRYISAGRLDTRQECGVTMIRASQSRR